MDSFSSQNLIPWLRTHQAVYQKRSAACGSAGETLRREKPEELVFPEQPNVIWSLDLMADRLDDSRALRLLNVLDEYNREGLGIEADISLRAERVVRSRDQIIEWRGKPLAIRVDNGPDYHQLRTQVLGPKQEALRSATSNPASRSRTPTSNATTEQCGTNGSASICSQISRRCRTRQQSGSGLTTMAPQGELGLLQDTRPRN